MPNKIPALQFSQFIVNNLKKNIHINFHFLIEWSYY